VHLAAGGEGFNNEGPNLGGKKQSGVEISLEEREFSYWAREPEGKGEDLARQVYCGQKGKVSRERGKLERG